MRAREHYLNRMVVITAEELNFPKNEINNMNFGTVMKQNIAEQFIPPLFCDSGNRKRFAFEYIRSCHNIRHEML